jgi:hypothetical protein
LVYIASWQADDIKLEPVDFGGPVVDIGFVRDQRALLGASRHGARTRRCVDDVENKELTKERKDPEYKPAPATASVIRILFPQFILVKAGLVADGGGSINETRLRQNNAASN